MSFYGYNEDVGEHYNAGYGHHFGAASQYSSPYDPDVGEQPILIDYTSPAYYTDDYSASAYSHPTNYTTCSYDYSVNQSETIYSQPNYLQYDPPPHYQVYFPSQTKFTTSYSTVELNEPEFPEYDLTPYDGGYDQTMTYGKPIPPSDLTCYPRSLPQSDAPPEKFDFASIPSPYVKDVDPPPIKPLPPIGSIPIPRDTKAGTGREDINVFDSIPSPHGKDDHPPIKHSPPHISIPIDTKAEAGRDSHEGGKANDDSKDVEIVEPKDVISSGDYASIEHQHGFVPGSGLEAMDICESLFGYWPCVAKKAQLERNQCRVCSHDTTTKVDMDPWKPAADYLFGSPVPYDYHNYHYHQSPYQSDQISWLQ